MVADSFDTERRASGGVGRGGGAERGRALGSTGNRSGRDSATNNTRFPRGTTRPKSHKSRDEAPRDGEAHRVRSTRRQIPQSPTTRRPPHKTNASELVRYQAPQPNVRGVQVSERRIWQGGRGPRPCWRERGGAQGRQGHREARPLPVQVVRRWQIPRTRRSALKAQIPPLQTTVQAHHRWEDGSASRNAGPNNTNSARQRVGRDTRSAPMSARPGKPSVRSEHVFTAAAPRPQNAACVASACRKAP